MWVVVEGSGVVRANGAELVVTEPGCFPVLEHGRHTAGVLELEAGEGVTVHATCFTPGVV